MVTVAVITAREMLAAKEMSGAVSGARAETITGTGGCYYPSCQCRTGCQGGGDTNTNEGYGGCKRG